MFDFDMTTLDDNAANNSVGEKAWTIHDTQTCIIPYGVKEKTKQDTTAVPFCLNTWQQMANNRPLYIFGIGRAGKLVFEYLRSVNLKVTGFIDNDPTKWDTVAYDLKVFGPKIINRNMYIIIASYYYEEIARQLEGNELQQVRDFDASYPIWFDALASRE
jgi:FlaA1/EpsC-like NDP-sugar epimerase